MLYCKLYDSFVRGTDCTGLVQSCDSLKRSDSKEWLIPKSWTLVKQRIEYVKIWHSKALVHYNCTEKSMKNYFLLMVNGKRKVKWVWNEMKVRKWWQIFLFWGELSLSHISTSFLFLFSHSLSSWFFPFGTLFFGLSLAAAHTQVGLACCGLVWLGWWL